MIVFPKAKINVGLRIAAKRPDGFHDIETIFYPVGLGDALEFVVLPDPHRKDILTVTGISIGSVNEDNLVMKTVRKIREKFSFPWLRIHLHKAIPAGAGLGGGSSDAASILKAINRYFGLSIDETALKAMALELGSDCPFFMESLPCYATGRGELLNPVKPVLNGYYLLLLNPGMGIITREAYKNCHPGKTSASLFQLINHPINEWKGSIINDFEEYVFDRHPHIADIKNGLYRAGALFSLMSGSGSTVYGIFKEKPDLGLKLKKFVLFEGII